MKKWKYDRSVIEQGIVFQSKKGQDSCFLVVCGGRIHPIDIINFSGFGFATDEVTELEDWLYEYEYYPSDYVMMVMAGKPMKKRSHK